MSETSRAMDANLREALSALGKADQMATAFAELANMNMALFKAHVDAGFTVPQALQLVGASLAAMVTSGGKQPE